MRVKFLVEQTQLRQRLVSLPREDFIDLEGEVDALLALAAEAEETALPSPILPKSCVRISSCNAMSAVRPTKGSS